MANTISWCRWPACIMQAGRLHYAAVLLAAVLLAGCGGESGPSLTPVSGTVSYKGQPARDVDVVFTPKAGASAASGRTDASGKYTLTTYSAGDGAAPGEYVVTISVPLDMPADMPSTGVAPRPKPLASATQIPGKYANAATSNLSAKVEEGESQEINFGLSD